MKLFIKGVGLSGVLLFGILFYLTFNIPLSIEQRAADFIKNKIEKAAIEKIDGIKSIGEGTKINDLAIRLLESNKAKADSLKQGLYKKVKTEAELVMVHMQDPNNQYRNAVITLLGDDNFWKLNALLFDNKQIRNFLSVKYQEVVKGLKIDLRIFLGSNLAIFFILLLVSFLKPELFKPLMLPTILLLCSTLFISYFYIFEQNWFFNILQNDYWGYTYLIYVGIIFGFLLDIVYLQAQISTVIVESIGAAIASVFS